MTAETMDFLLSQGRSSDMGSEIIDNFIIKTKNGSDMGPRSRSVSFRELKEQRDPLDSGNDDEYIEVERRDDDSQLPSKKKVLFRPGSRNSGDSRADASSVSQRYGVDDDDQSHTSRWSISSKKSRAGRLFSRNKRQAIPENLIPVVDEENVMQKSKEQETVQAILKETETFLQELNESLDQHDGSVARGGSMDHTGVSQEGSSVDHSPSVLGSASEMTSVQQETDKVKKGTDWPAESIVQGTLRIFGFALPTSDAQINATESVNAVDSGLVNASTQDEKGSHDVCPESPVKQNEEEERQGRVGLESLQTKGEIATVLSESNKIKATTRGLLLSKQRKNNVDEGHDDLVAQVVPIMDPEGAQMVLGDKSTTGSGQPLTAKEKKAKVKADKKVKSLLSRLMRKTDSTRKRRLAQHDATKDKDAQETSIQVESSTIPVSNEEISHDIEEVTEKVEEDEDNVMRVVSDVSTPEVVGKDETVEFSPSREKSVIHEDFVSSIKEVLKALTPEWPFPDPFQSKEQPERGGTHVSSSTSFNQEKRHLVKILNSDFASSSQKRKAEMRLREMFESRKSSASDATARRRSQSSADDDSSAYSSTDLSDDDSQSECSTFTETEACTAPAPSIEESYADSVAKAPVNRNRMQKDDRKAGHGGSAASRVSTTSKVSATGIISITKSSSTGTRTLRTTLSSRHVSPLIPKDSFDSSIQHKYTPVLDLFQDNSEDAQDVNEFDLRYTPILDVLAGNPLVTQEQADSSDPKGAPLPETSDDSAADPQEQTGSSIQDESAPLPELSQSNVVDASGLIELVHPISNDNTTGGSATFDGQSVGVKPSPPLNKSTTETLDVIAEGASQDKTSTQITSEESISTKDERSEGVASISTAGIAYKRHEDIAMTSPNLSINHDPKASKPSTRSVSSFEAPVSKDRKKADVVGPLSDLTPQKTTIEPVHGGDISVINEERQMEDITAPKTKKVVAAERDLEKIHSIRELVTSLFLDTFDPKPTLAPPDVPVSRVMRIPRTNPGILESDSSMPSKSLDEESWSHSSMPSKSLDEELCSRSRADADPASGTNGDTIEASIPNASLDEESCSRSPVDAGPSSGSNQDSLEASIPSASGDEGTSSRSRADDEPTSKRGDILLTDRMPGTSVDEGPSTPSQATTEQASNGVRDSDESRTLLRARRTRDEGSHPRVRGPAVAGLTQRYLASVAEDSSKTKAMGFTQKRILSANEELTTTISSIIRDVARAASIEIAPSVQDIDPETSTTQHPSGTTSSIPVKISATEMETLKNHAKILGIDVDVLIAARMK